MRRRVAVLLGTTAAAGVLSVALAPAAMAHPLGNFTRNTSVEFSVSPEHVAVTHVLDLAEVPTYQERRAMDTSGDGTVSGVEAQAWGRSRCATSAEQVLATTGAGPLAWTVGASSVTFPQGQGGLPTTRLECAFGADVAGLTTLDATISIEAGRVGWHELTAVGVGVTLSADVPTVSVSQQLTAYPTDIAPLDVTSAHLAWTVGGDGPGAPQVKTSDVAATVTTIAPRGLDSATLAFTDLVGRHDVTLGFGLLALVIALALGGLHALAPGHGKTLMAASLLGTGGRRRDALVLGASVTTAHTAGVVILAVALSLSTTIAPETAYPWLGLASAALAIGVGLSLLRQARRGGGLGHHHGHGHAHPHPHPHPHGHSHREHGHAHHGHDGGHSHGSVHTSGVLSTERTEPGALAVVTRTSTAAQVPTAHARPATRRVVALGLAGGLVPSPSAVVVLLAGFALGRAWFALLLVVAYGLGMALTLCVTGLVLVRASGLSRRVASGSAVPRPVSAVLSRLPTLAACVVILTGLWLGVRSILAL